VLRFAAARGLQAAVSLWVALTVLFLAITQLPGDPVAALFGFNRPPPEVYEALRRQYHLDEPVLQQYVLYLRDVLSGDLGNSYPRDPFSGLRVGTPVMDVVRRTAPVSAVVVVASLLVQVVVGVTAGALSAGLGRRAGTSLYAAALLLVSTPVLVAAYVLRTGIGTELRWLPVRGLYSGWEGYVLPVLALSALSTGFVVLLTRGEVRETLAARYVKAARGRGIPPGVVLRRHALRPALLPVVAFLAANTGQLFVGLVIVEGVFDLPGLGGALFDAVLRQDRSLLMGLATVIMAVVIVANACADLLAAALDPRLRLGADDR
jgi:oligopeptide transport system permease protein